MRFCRESLQMEDDDIVVFDNEELLWFHHEIWGNKPEQSLYSYSDLKGWQTYYKLDPLDITEDQ
jgi:hypothetical protein